MPFSEDWPGRTMPTSDNVEQISFQQQIIYKLAAMEASMKESFRRLDENLASHKNDLHRVELKMVQDNGELDKRVLANKTQIDELHTWTRVVRAQIAAYTGGALLIWALIGPHIQKALGID